MPANPNSTSNLDAANERRFWIGIVGSVLLLAAAIWFAIKATPENQPQKLNEWGDFFAGVTAPIAFLWLILGYRQQGDELRQNTLALKMQEEELHNQVSETQNLVRATIEMAKAAQTQADATAAIVDEGRKRAAPRIVVRDENMHGGPMECVGHFANHGAAAGFTRIECLEPGFSGDADTHHGMIEAAYLDSGSGERCSFWDLTARLFNFGDWKAAHAHYATKVGVKLPGEREASGKKGGKKKAVLKGEQLKKHEATDAHPSLIQSFCNSRPGITPDAIHAAVGKVRIWNGMEVIAFPGWEEPPSPPQSDSSPKPMPVAVMFYRADGKDFPAVYHHEDHSCILKKRKNHLLAGSVDSWVFVCGKSAFVAANTVHVCEGIPDALTLYPHLPAGHVVVTNLCGASVAENVRRDIFKGKIVNVWPDQDEVGEKGREKFAKSIQHIASEVRIVPIPMPVGAVGKDIRDFLNAGGTFEQLTKAADIVAPLCTPISNAILEINGKEEELVPLRMTDILSEIRERTDGWPRCVGGELFIHAGTSPVQYLETAPALFGWLGHVSPPAAEFQRGVGFHSQHEVFAELQRTSTSYDAIESLPHEPSIPNHYYACAVPEPGDGSTLDALIDEFNPETPTDILLFRALCNALLGRPRRLAASLCDYFSGWSRRRQVEECGSHRPSRRWNDRHFCE